MADNGFKVNRTGIRKLLLSDGTGRILMDKAQSTAGRARSTAPVETGDYQESIEARLETHGDRLVARVYADSDHAAIVESRTRNLGKALGNR